MSQSPLLSFLVTYLGGLAIRLPANLVAEFLPMLCSEPLRTLDTSSTDFAWAVRTLWEITDSAYRMGPSTKPFKFFFTLILKLFALSAMRLRELTDWFLSWFVTVFPALMLWICRMSSNDRLALIWAARYMLLAVARLPLLWPWS